MAAKKPSKLNFMEGLSTPETSYAKNIKMDEASKVEPEISEKTDSMNSAMPEESSVEINPKEDITDNPNWEDYFPRASKNARSERVRDASTILSLLIPPDIKSFIKFEAERKGQSMNEYICSLVRPDFEKDKEVYFEYKKYQEGLAKFKMK